VGLKVNSSCLIPTFKVTWPWPCIVSASYNICIQTENRATTSFIYCSSTASLPVRPHCTNARRIRRQADLNNFPLAELEETTGMPHTMWMKTTPAGPGTTEPLPEQSNQRGSESSTLEIDVYVWCYALIVVHVRNKWMNEFHIRIFFQVESHVTQKLGKI